MIRLVALFLVAAAACSSPEYIDADEPDRTKICEAYCGCDTGESRQACMDSCEAETRPCAIAVANCVIDAVDDDSCVALPETPPINPGEPEGTIMDCRAQVEACQ